MKRKAFFEGACSRGANTGLKPTLFPVPAINPQGPLLLAIFVVLLVAYLCQRLLGFVPWPALACTAVVLLVTPALGVVLLVFAGVGLLLAHFY